MSILMISNIATLLYIALPAFVANMMPVVAAKFNFLPNLNIPIDCGKKLRNHELLGKNKTVRGLIVGIVSGAFVALVQYYFPFFLKINFSDAFTAIFFGAMAGFGAIFGDAIASMIKRQFNIPSGKPFIPLDQIDYILGFLLFTTPFITWSVYETLILLLFALIANPLTNIISYLLGIKKTYW